jgi:electron transfer flavoprotein alpha subunit
MRTPCSEKGVGMKKSVYVIALHDGGRFPQETFEVIAFARMLQDERPRIIVPSDIAMGEPLSRELSRNTGLDVIGLTGNSLDQYSAEAYVKHLSAFFKDAGDSYICIPHTAQGSDFAPQLSARIGACCITAIEGLEDGSFVRSVFGGKYQSLHRPATPSAVLTVMPGAWRQEEGREGPAGQVKMVSVAQDSRETRLQGTRESTHTNMALTAAEVVVSAGRGVGKAENISNVRSLATLFPKSAIGSTRAVCDLGWLDYTHQIGSTGNKVSPRLYIACGISGAIQHIAGMKDSRIVMAINTDRTAPIFGVARYCIVEDVNTFIPLVLDAYAHGLRKG